MTIKIISKGIDPKTIPLRGTCYTCKTVVECDQRDAKYETGDWGHPSAYSVPCPVCNSPIIVEKHVHFNDR